MYLREVTSPRKHGADAVYLQLVEGERDTHGRVQTRILHSFGRKDRLDLAQIRRLVGQLSRYLDAEDAPDLLDGLEVAATWDYGGPYVLDALWRELELDRFFAAALEARAFEQPLERSLFALVAQRALAPGSKLAASRWAGARAWIPGLEDGGEGLEVQHLYRAMDFLAAEMPSLQEHLYFQVTDLLNTDVSVLFYDTTSVSFYLEEADADGSEGEEAAGEGRVGLRRYGHSKKKRPDLPQIVVGLAINREGLPVRHWVFPGNRTDKTTVEAVVSDLMGLRPRRFLFVGDRGMVSAANLDWLESRRLPYLLGCPLRSDDVISEHVLSLRGRYRPVREGLGVKETVLTEGGRSVRYLLCRDEGRAQHDARTREQIVSRLERELATHKRATERHTKKSCELMSKSGYARFLRELKGGGLRLDRAAIAAEARLDGKYVLMTNELDLPAEELVAGYRDLWRAERAFRSMKSVLMKSVLEIEPVFHRTPERITAHVHLCVLAYLLTKVVENKSGLSWEQARERLERIALTKIESARATVLQTTRLGAQEKAFLNSCGVTEPPPILQLT